MIPLSIEGHVHYLINVSSYYVSDVFVCLVYVIPEASKIGIRDLTKKRCGIRENAKYRDRIRDLTATREARFAKICARDAGYSCLSVGNSGNRHVPNKRSSGKSESTRRVQNINLHLAFMDSG